MYSFTARHYMKNRGMASKYSIAKIRENPFNHDQIFGLVGRLIIRFDLDVKYEGSMMPSDTIYQAKQDPVDYSILDSVHLAVLTSEQVVVVDHFS
jgi:hypothetical protein